MGGDQILTEHFDRREFEKDGPMPEECVPTYRSLCVQILEPVRAEFGPVVVTSGYRDPADNAAAHGVAHSQHEATAEYCAADFTILGVYARRVFDWIRGGQLPFDQVILEHGLNNDIIHVSWTSGSPRREALEGDTANRSAYVELPVAPLLPGTGEGA